MPRAKKSRKIDPTILSAIIGAAAVIIATIIGPALDNSCGGSPNKVLLQKENKPVDQPGNKIVSIPSQENGQNKADYPFVYITKKGKSYHLGHCSRLKKSKIEIKLNDAKRLGYTPCSICKPPQ